MQLDAKDAAIAALKREVALLRAENQYLRDQASTSQSCAKHAFAVMSLPCQLSCNINWDSGI